MSLLRLDRVLTARAWMAMVALLSKSGISAPSRELNVKCRYCSLSLHHEACFESRAHLAGCLVQVPGCCISLNDLFDCTSKVAALVVASWKWAAFDILLAIPAGATDKG